MKLHWSLILFILFLWVASVALIGLYTYQKGYDAGQERMHVAITKMLDDANHRVAEILNEYYSTQDIIVHYDSDIKEFIYTKKH